MNINHSLNWNNPGEYHLNLQAPEGNLEALITIPPEKNDHFIAIICHPHSLHGGTMNNKVVTTLTKIFSDLHIPNVRFNFRGVGESHGHFADGIGEAEDLRSVISWVKSQSPTSKLCLAGFSFGSFVAYQVSHQVETAVLITVAPPIARFNYDLNSLPTCPWIVIQGEEDEIVFADEVFDWVKDLPREVTLLRFPNTGHFFHGKLILMRERLLPMLKKILFPLPPGEG